MMRTLYIILFFIICVAVGAAGDALNYRKHGGWGHALCAIEVLMLLCGGTLFGVMVHTLVWYVVGYTLIRFALFSYIWNIIAGQHWTYIGTVDITDRFLRWVTFNDPDTEIIGRVKTYHGILFARIVFLMMGSGMLYWEL